MSSIYGILSLQSFRVDEQLSSHIRTETGWWKPDKDYTYVTDEILLGEQSIDKLKYSPINEDAIFNHPTGLKVISDARIDNRNDLINMLKCRQDISNSELILLLYIKYKEQSLSKLIGAFAFAIWDSKENTLFCAVDQMGVKPFCYYHSQELFAFGTQKKSITAIKEVDNAPNWRYIFNTLSNIGFENETTEYQHIRHLAPGHFIKIKDKQLEIKKYWELDIHKQLSFKKDGEYVDAFKDLLKEAISCRMDANGAVGTHLSGGLDSSGITSLANKIAKESQSEHKILSYNIIDDFEDKVKHVEENLLAFDLVKFLDADSIFTNVNEPIERDIYEMVSDETLFCDGRSKSNNVNTEYEIQAEASKQNIPVMLSGFPGDELVTSFCRPFYLEYFSKRQFINYFTKQKKSRHTFKDKFLAFGAASATSLFPKASKNLSFKYAARRYKDQKYKGKSIFLNKDYFTANADLEATLKPEFHPVAHSSIPTSLKEYQRNHVCRPHTYLRMESEQLAGKKWHVEYRYPLADIRLLEFMISIPMEQKISADMSRRIFRKGMDGLIPDSIRLRDIKNAGSLKPMTALKRQPKRMTLIDFIQKLKEENNTPFLNLEYVEKWVKSKQNPLALYPWMILAKLGHDGKLDFNSI